MHEKKSFGLCDMCISYVKMTENCSSSCNCESAKGGCLRDVTSRNRHTSV